VLHKLFFKFCGTMFSSPEPEASWTWGFKFVQIMTLGS